MRFRFTVNELQNESHNDYMSDLKMLRAVVAERKSDCTNVHAPLYKRLQKIYNKLDKAIEAGMSEIPSPTPATVRELSKQFPALYDGDYMGKGINGTLRQYGYKLAGEDNDIDGMYNDLKGYLNCAIEPLKEWD